jgi:hypothetical protein
VSKLRSHLTFANVVACIALFVALGGTSVAAVSLKKNSVGSKQIKNSSLTGADIKNSSLGSTDIKNRALLAKDFKSGQLPAGARGATGAQGAAGATNVTLRTGTTPVPSGAAGGFQAAAFCAAGERAVGGGARISDPRSGEIMSASVPLTAGTEALNPPGAGVTPTGWGAFYGVFAPINSARTLTAHVVCARP